MNHADLNPAADDDLLDRAIRAILNDPAPAALRTRTLASASGWTLRSVRRPVPNRRRLPWLLSAAAAVLLVLTGAMLLVTFRNRHCNTPLAGTRPAVPGGSITRPVDADVRRFDTAAYWTSTVQVQVADDAPIMVANGAEAPIHTGASIPQRSAGDLLHIWDWSKSPLSQVRKDVELGMNQRVLVLPDGKLFVWARNTVINLGTAAPAGFEVGEMNTHIGVGIYRRIGQTRFSPTGDRLAMQITEFDPTLPGRIQSEVIRIVEFPGGKTLCEFPPGESYALRIAFSADGKHIVSGDPVRIVTLRDASSGQVLRQFQPALDRQIMGVALSPNGTRVAAYERTDFSNEPAKQKYGDLYIWNAQTGQLLHRMSGTELQKLGGRGPSYGALRFSPDSQHLAAESWGRVFVIDVAAGQVVSALKQGMAQSLQWSADGKTLTAITPVSGNQGPAGRVDVYPSIYEWDWQAHTVIRTLSAPKP